jgi:transposase
VNVSLKLQGIPEVPEEARRVAQAAFARGNFCMSVRDHLGVVYEDEQFQDLFSHRGQPAASPWRLAFDLRFAVCRKPLRSPSCQCGACPDRLEVLFAELEEGLLKARGKQRTDSTHVLAAVRAFNRLECVGETMRHALNHLAVVAPEWLLAHSRAEWVDRYGSRVDDYRVHVTETCDPDTPTDYAC